MTVGSRGWIFHRKTGPIPDPRKIFTATNPLIGQAFYCPVTKLSVCLIKKNRWSWDHSRIRTELNVNWFDADKRKASKECFNFGKLRVPSELILISLLLLSSSRLVQYACRMIWDTLDSSHTKKVDNKELIGQLKNLESILSQFRKGKTTKLVSYNSPR